MLLCPYSEEHNPFSEAVSERKLLLNIIQGVHLNTAEFTQVSILSHQLHIGKQTSLFTISAKPNSRYSLLILLPVQKNQGMGFFCLF